MAAVTYKKNPDGSLTLSDGVNTATHLSPAIEAQVKEVEMSFARRLLSRLRAGKLSAGQSRLERVEVQGAVLWCKRLDWAGISAVQLMVDRDEMGRLDISEGSDHLRAFAVAVFCAVFFEDEEGTRPCFSRAEAFETVDDPEHDVIVLVTELMEHALRITPDLVPSFYRGVGLPPRPIPTPPMTTAQVLAEPFTNSTPGSGGSGSE